MEILNDFSTSVEKALSEIDPNWKNYEGLIVCGTHSPKNVEDIIEKIKNARENNIPFLGICAGMQFMAIELARNLYGIKDATSEEFGKGTFVVRKMPKLRVGVEMTGYYVGGKHYQELESHWHNYEVTNTSIFKDADSSEKVPAINSGVRFNGFSGGFGKPFIIEQIHLAGDNFFEGYQFHPEYQSSIDNPHPILVKFLEYAKQRTR